MTPPLKPHPQDRDNWEYLNEGQRRYAVEQWQLARVRRGLPIDHPIPEIPADHPTALPTGEDILDELPEGNPDDVEEFDLDQLPAEPGPSSDPDTALVSNPDDSTPPDEGDSSSMSAPLTPPVTPVKTPAKGKGKRGDKGSSSTSGKKTRMSGTSLPGTGAEIASEGGGQAIIPVPRPIYTAHNNIIILNKVHRFLTYGLGNTVVQIKRTINTSTYDDNFVMTSLARLPVDRPFFYMNPSEFEQLPPGSCIEEVNVRVTAFTPRIAFQTNSSETALATLNQNQFILYAIGLNISTQGVDVRPKTFKDKEPMIVESIDEIGEKKDAELFDGYVKEFYGHKDVPTHVPRHQFGIPYPLQNYFALVNQTYGTLQNPGYECLQSFVSEIRINGPPGEIVEYNYKPQLGLIKTAIPAIYTGVPSALNGAATLSCPAGSGNSQYRTADFTMTNNILTGDKETFKDTVTSNHPWVITDPIEKSQVLHAGAFPSFKPKAQPSLHIGVKPVPSLTTANLDDNLNNSSFTDSQAYFVVEAVCKVRIQYPTLRPLFSAANTSPENQLYGLPTTDVTHALGKSTIMGLQQK
nr:MAG: structural protein 2 [Motacilla cinerea ambidensovirus]